MKMNFLNLVLFILAFPLILLIILLAWPGLLLLSLLYRLSDIEKNPYLVLLALGTVLMSWLVILAYLLPTTGGL